ncbi:MAG: selenocysteine-specific translation elongation factor [Acidimicrobiales bacterium]
MRVFATAGHVDHGKSTLVLALTGTDPDRWAEEKARGLTIDLGFAATTLDSGQEIAFVDVPGHGRFVKNMLAGVSAVDACVFVVAATEGWKAQSEEHLRILDLLGISRGLVALTKVGLIDDELAELAELEVRERLEGTFLAGAEVVHVDVPAGIGVEDLRSALDRLVAATPAAADRGRPRLWVDRSFPVRGAGTVVTGTLIDGTLSVDDDLVVEPGGQPVRVRALQSHHRTLERAEPGRRLAVNVTGIAHHQVARGQALVRAGQWHRARVVDASLQVLGLVDHPVSARGAFAAYLGSGDFPVRLRVIGTGREIEPGKEGAVRLWLGGQAPLALLPGDRYVLRELGRGETVGGGVVLDVDPVLSLSRARPSADVDRVVAERGRVDADELERLTGDRRAPTAGRWVMAPAALAACRHQICDAVRAAGTAGVDLAALSEVQRAVLAQGVDGVAVVDGRAVDAAAATGEMSAAAVRVLAELEARPWSPPELPLADRAALRELERRGLAVEAGELWFATVAVDAAAGVVRGLLGASPKGFTVSQAREALGSTRKFVLPLLAHLDATGVTRRQEALRVAGPRLARRVER